MRASDLPDMAGLYHQMGEQDQRMVDLWRAILAQAMRDMDTGKSQGKRQVELEALQWFKSEDFSACCICALVDPIELRSRLDEVLSLKAPYRRLMLRDLAEMIKDPPPKPVADEGEFTGALLPEPEDDA